VVTFDVVLVGQPKAIIVATSVANGMMRAAVTIQLLARINHKKRDMRVSLKRDGYQDE
jgi:hypothetical protein